MKKLFKSSFSKSTNFYLKVKSWFHRFSLYAIIERENNNKNNKVDHVYVSISIFLSLSLFLKILSLSLSYNVMFGWLWILVLILHRFHFMIHLRLPSEWPQESYAPQKAHCLWQLFWTYINQLAKNKHCQVEDV